MKVSGAYKRYSAIVKNGLKNGFYNTTRELDSSVMLSRGLIDTFGCTIPWLIMANNDTERQEKTRRYLINYVLVWLTPFVTLPLSNRFAMKHIAKLTKSFWSNNHKAMIISNKFLKDKDLMMPELQKMADKTNRYPLESLFNRFFPKKKYAQKIDIKELLKSVDGDTEKLRQKLIKAKNAVFVSDCIFTFGSGATVLFLNNEITRKKTGQAGFSAEMGMADKETVEKRAESYEKNKKKKYLAAAGLTVFTALGMSLAAFATLYSKNPNKIVQKLRNGSRWFDYNKGIYMSRLPFFLGNTSFVGVNLLAGRNNTERKDLAIRQCIGDAVFFGGDLLLASVFTNMCDRIFGTKLCMDDGSNSSVIRKIFPKIKPIKQVYDEVKNGKISTVNKKVSSGIFWSNMVILMVAMGYVIPTLINKMIRHDVAKDVEAQNKKAFNLSVKPVKMEDFINNAGIK